MVRRPIDPDEDLKLMAQEVRDYVEAVLNSLAANIPKVTTMRAHLIFSFTGSCIGLWIILKISFAGSCIVPSGESKGCHAKSTIQLHQV